MSLRSIFPYIAIVFLFAFVYWLTMVIPTETLYAIFGEKWQNNWRSTKLAIQIGIFDYGLTPSILMVNILEYCTTAEHGLFRRILKSTLTIILVFITAWCIYQLMGAPKVFNMYYYHGSPARLWCTLIIVFTFLSLIVLELMLIFLFSLIPKEKIIRRIPSWLRIEARPNNINTH
ncbi:MAG: hypothetical protein J7623_12990 [Chitinophaga sp.]|uniref:hypothetical protein n=1 Tax=Chitinophaga sp. TaxID=1869181 RepID=UPI001AFD8F60|nr:hypothetical protein [Chitinophaga sp.]MBO9729546.1 hypothetical protein [Chitinophaga sp.]